MLEKPILMFVLKFFVYSLMVVPSLLTVCNVGVIVISQWPNPLLDNALNSKSILSVSSLKNCICVRQVSLIRSNSIRKFGGWILLASINQAYPVRVLFSISVPSDCLVAVALSMYHILELFFVVPRSQYRRFHPWYVLSFTELQVFVVFVLLLVVYQQCFYCLVLLSFYL